MGLNESFSREQTFSYPGSLCNVLFQANEVKSPRGIRGFKLDVGHFTEWKVQGKVGGYTEYVFYITSQAIDPDFAYQLPRQSSRSVSL